MSQPFVVVVGRDRTLQEALGTQVRQAGMRAVFLEEAQALLQMAGEGEAPRGVFLDLDGQAVDQVFFRRLATALPGIRAILVSAEPFHPELREAMATVVLASMAKPLDPAEVEYWLRTLVEARSADGEGT